MAATTVLVQSKIAALENIPKEKLSCYLVSEWTIFDLRDLERE
jgi:hypothetical protein